MNRLPANLYDPKCPSRLILDLVGSRWGMLMVCSLENGPVRANALIRAIGGISEKMFRQTARDLEKYGIVHRRSFPEVPPRVEYSLTPLGQGLCGVIRNIEVWVLENFDELVDHSELATEKQDS
jgi:DNA-binding HxlR family transcriptional regulator